MGLWAYEQDLSLELVAEYVVFNWNKHTMLLQAIGKMLGGIESTSGRMTPQYRDELMDYYEKSLRKQIDR